MTGYGLEQQVIAQAWQPVALSTQVSPYVDAEYRIAGNLLMVPQVESVVIRREDSITRVWTVVDADDDQVFDAVYDRERIIIRDLSPERFDFHVVARKGRPLRSVMTMGYRIWQRK